MLTAKKLGDLQADIYFLHDARQFDKLSATASLIFELTGTDKKRADRVGILISSSYQLADKAEEYRRLSNSTEENNFYIAAHQKLTEAEKMLDYKEGTATHQINWWKYFRHNKMLKVIYHIFLQHLKPYGLLGASRALLLTYYLIRAGLGHNKRNKQLSALYSEKYWSVILKNKRHNHSFLG